MLPYNAWIAFKSMRRNPWMSTLIIGVIALGITISTSFIAIYHLLARHPLPDKAETVHYVRMDSWDPLHPYPGDSPTPPPQLTYRDVRGLMQSDIPLRQTPGFEAQLYVYPDPKIGRPFLSRARLVYADFFQIFEVPFQYGGGWSREADDKLEQVVVLNSENNDRLFGGRNSVGESFRIEDKQFRVVGVLAASWRPSPRVYDLTHDVFQPPEGVFIPFNLLEPMEIFSSGNTDGWGPPPPDRSFKTLLNTETAYLQFWVELPTPEKKQAYVDFLRAYVMEQKKAGRFPRPIDNRLTTISELSDEWAVVPPQARALAWISVLFLAVCSLNLMGLLLAKFLARASEVGVRRALGANRLAVFVQHIVECEVVGLTGGAIGLLLSIAILALFSKAFPQLPAFRLDAPMVAASVMLSLVAGLIAGLYPAWRICRIAPAAHLKIQ
jgi:putative ABC transport system permease protein